MTRFNEMCLDTAGDPGELARFWAAVSGGRAEGDNVLGQLPYQGIAICPVPETKTVKNRVHLDVYAQSLDDLVAWGATVLEPFERWTQMLDPQGNEFCAFLREELPAYRVHGFGIDSADPERIARWWGDVLGVEPRTWDGEDFWTLEHATPDPVLTWDFVPVPEPKTVKNRMHWDVFGDPAELLDLGATFLWEVPGRTRPIAWTTLADPEGNEFCVFPESDAPVS